MERFKSFRDRMLQIQPRASNPRNGELQPSNPKQSNRVPSTSPMNKGNKGILHSRRGNGVQKTRSSSNLSASRMELIGRTTEAQMKKSTLPSIVEAPKETHIDRYSNKNLNVEFQNSTSDFVHRSSEASLQKLPAATLAKALIDIRDENASLKFQIKQLRSQQPNSTIIPVNEPSNTELKAALQLISTLQDELKLSKTKLKESERAKNRMFKDLARATRMEASLYDDSHFIEATQQLRWQVYNWVKNEKWKVVTQSQYRVFEASGQYRSLQQTCPSYRDYLGTRKGIDVLVEAHIWQSLVHDVFACNLWAETRDRSKLDRTDMSENPFTAMKRALRPELIREHEEDAKSHEKEIQEWRVASVRLVALRDSVLVDSIIVEASQRITLVLSKTLKPLFSGAESRNPAGLVAIFDSAIRLDFLMQQQRADYLFFPVFPREQPWWLRFDAETMETMDEDFDPMGSKGLPEVKIVVQPNLSKYGDNEGKNYRTKSCLLKAEVEV